MLAERFPESARTRTGGLPSGVAGIDALLGGGFPAGRLTEIVSAVPSGGGQLVLARALASARAGRVRAALVDAGLGFDPQSLEGDCCLRHLVWVKCRAPLRALQAAEMLVRDGNFALVALDMRGVAPREWRRVPPTAWYRLQRAAEPGEAAVLVQSDEPRVASAACRISLERSLGLAEMAQPRAGLADKIEAVLVRGGEQRLRQAG